MLPRLQFATRVRSDYNRTGGRIDRLPPRSRRSQDIPDRIGSWKTSAAGSGGPQGAITAETAEPGASCTSKLTLIGTLPPAERARQAKSSRFFRILGEGDATQGKPAPRPRLEQKGIRDGEVVDERFVRPFAGPLSHPAIRLVG